MEKQDIRCGAVGSLSECSYATIGNGYFGCECKDPCAHKRPQIKESNDYATVIKVISEWEDTKPSIVGINPLFVFCKDKMEE